jgi:hypothetical protein
VAEDLGKADTYLASTIKHICMHRWAHLAVEQRSAVQARHDTAQHPTAPHGTAPHSTAPHSTARCTTRYTSLQDLLPGRWDWLDTKLN